MGKAAGLDSRAVKIIGFIRRRPDFDFATFSRHWRTVHRAHAEKLRPWLGGYVQAHYRPGPVADVQRPADGSPMLWVDGPEAMAAMAASDEFRTGAMLDEPLFMEGRSSGLAVEPAVIVSRVGAAAVKLMLFACAAPGTTYADLEADWLCGATHACGRTVNHAPAGQTIDPAVRFDAVEELWWPDEAAFRADWSTARGPADINWLVPAGLKAAFVEEIEVFAPPV